MKLAVALTNQTAVALENARLYEKAQHEIQERKQTEHALKESERKYRTLFEKSADAIFIVDRKNGRYLDANQAAVRLSGRSLSELKQLTTRDVTPHAYVERLSVIAESSSAEDLGRVVYVHPDGTERIATLSTVPLDNDAVIGIARDITDELDMEEQLRQAQKMESIGTLAGGIAHDFNNILFPIVAVSEMMMQDYPLDGPEYQRANQIFKAGKRGSALVKQILAFSRQSEHKFVPVKLQSILRDVIKLSRSTIPSSISIVENIQKDCPLINADPTQVHQIVMNLITNAYHAVEVSGDEIRVELLETEVDHANTPVLSFEPGQYAKLSVSDNGAGIDPRLKEKIFDPYFTTKQQGKGTGLGLSVVYGIVKEHKGAIVVDSVVGKGSTFHVYLPLLPEKDDRPVRFEEEKVATGTESILLVDDEETIVDIERMILERLGYRVSWRVNSLEALEAFKANPDKFDLVITDMTMPNMTGDRLTEELIAVRANIPVILCTGFSENIDKEKAEAAGIKGFLMKPIVMADMANMVRRVLDEAKGLPRN
jgi:PAS domain S-box-containing protein